MNEQLERLVRLQEIESRYDRLDRASKSIPDQIQGAREGVVKAQAELEELKAASETVSRRKRDKERELNDCEEKLTKARERQGELKSNKEYQAHLHELEALMAGKGKIEEELLVLMDETDMWKARVESVSEKVRIAEEEFNKVQSALEEKKRTLEHELEQVGQKREALATDVEGTVLKRYKQLMSQQKGEVVVPIKDGSCGGCFMNVPPQLVAEVKTGKMIHACSECRRILYWPESSPDSTSTGVNPTV